jgi:ribulose-5-phosphate 4-epimerase/fuculose-1-phosphate aldolase
MNENDVRDSIVALGRSLYDRGLAHGSAGNISVKLPDGWLITPTESCLGRLDPARLSRVDTSGTVVSGDAPTKEILLHSVMYEERPTCEAVVHLHSVHAVALSCIDGLDSKDAFPPITAYAIMQLGAVALVPYYAPGEDALATALRRVATRHHAVLLSNHGPVVAGSSLDAAVNAIEELEETAKLLLLLQGHSPHYLTPRQVLELNRRFKS